MWLIFSSILQGFIYARWTFDQIMPYIQQASIWNIVKHCVNIYIGNQLEQYSPIAPWEIWLKFSICNFQANYNIRRLRSLVLNCLRFMSLNFNDCAFIHVVRWFRLAISHHLNQCWPKPMSPYGVTKGQCVTLFHIVHCIHPFVLLCGIMLPSRPLLLINCNINLKEPICSTGKCVLLR